MVGLILMAVLCLQGPQEVELPVSHTGPAVSVGKLLESLSNASGVKLRATTSVASDIVILSVRERPLKEIMTKLAGAMNAQWSISDGIHYLERTPKQIRADQKLELDQKIAELKKGLEHLNRGLLVHWDRESIIPIAERKLQGQEGASGQNWEDFQIYGPAPRALARCLKDIPVQELASVEIGWRAVYSTSPIGIQRSLGSNAREALMKLQTEQEIWGQSLRSANKDPESKFFEDEVSAFEDANDFFGSFHHDPWERTLPFTHDPSRILVEVSNEWYGSVKVKLDVLDDRNKPLIGFEMDIREPRSEQAEEPKDRGLGNVELSENSLAWGKLHGSDLPPEKVEQARAKIKPYIQDAVKHEPLGLGLSDGLLSHSKAVKKSLVGYLPDDLFSMGPTEASETLTHFIWGLSNEALIEENDDWITIGPRRPDSARLDRASRAGMRDVAQGLMREGMETIELFAEYTSIAGRLPAYHFADYYLISLLPNDSRIQTGNPNLDDFYGSLTSAQRTRLAAGGVMTYSELNPLQLLMAKRAIYGVRYSYSQRGAHGSSAETTELLPDGPSPNGRILAPESKVSSVWFLDPNSPRDYPLFQAELEGNGPGGWMGAPPLRPKRGIDSIRYQLMLRSVVKLELELSPGCFYGYSIEAHPLPTTKPIPWAELPEHIRKKIEPSLKFYKELSIERPVPPPSGG